VWIPSSTTLVSLGTSAWRGGRGLCWSSGRVSPVLVKVVYQKLDSKKSCFIYLGGSSEHYLFISLT